MIIVVIVKFAERQKFMYKEANQYLFRDISVGKHQVAMYFTLEITTPSLYCGCLSN